MKAKLILLSMFVIISALVSNSALAALPDGKTYKVTMVTSWGAEFEDCMIFTEDGFLLINGINFPMFFRQQDLTEHPSKWQSITVPDAPVEVAFTGVVRVFGDRGSIAGDGINEFGDTFIFYGKEKLCLPPAPEERNAKSPYIQ